MTAPLKLTDAEIDAMRSPGGAWTRKTLAGWGVPWPPPHGWRKALLEGRPVPGKAAQRSRYQGIADELAQTKAALASALADVAWQREEIDRLTREREQDSYRAAGITSVSYD